MEGVLIVAIVFIFVTKVVNMSLRHHENIERIRHGYPPISGTSRDRDERSENADYIDTRQQ